MLWLTWQMWILLVLAFGAGLVAGWLMRGQPDEEPQAAPSGGGKSASRDEGAAAGSSSEASGASRSKAESEPEAKSKPEPGPKAAPDAKSAMTLTAGQQAPGADADPVSDGPKSQTSGGVSTPDPATAPEKPGEDDLTAIKGLGPKAEAALKAEGVTSYIQIASWSEEDVKRFDDLINGRGRIKRDDWVGQAKTLAAG